MSDLERILPVLFELREGQRRLEEKQDRILRELARVRRLQTEETMTLDDLLAKTAEQKTVDDSIIALLGSVKAQLDAAIATGDLAKIQAVGDALDANTKAIVDAVKANTPAAPAPAPVAPSP